MSWTRWDHFQLPERKQKDLVPTLTPGEHICLARLSKEFTRNWAWCLVSFSPWVNQTSVCCISPQPVLVPCSPAHPRTGFSTNLRNSYTKLRLSYPREHLPLHQTQLFQQWQSDTKGVTGPRRRDKGYLNGWANTLEELPEGEQEDTQYVFGQSNGFFSTGITIKGY